MVISCKNPENENTHHSRMYEDLTSVVSSTSCASKKLFHYKTSGKINNLDILNDKALFTRVTIQRKFND